MMPFLSRFLTPTAMILSVFWAASGTLLASVSRDMRDHPELPLWKEHLDSYIANS